MGTVKGKIEWISVLQGFAMVMVVAGHAWLTSFIDPVHPVATGFIQVIYHFHMALFFAVSGYLFWITRLSKDWKWLDIIAEKSSRLMIPYLFFTTVTMGLKLVLPNLMQRKAELSIVYWTKSILYPGDNPLGELWFIGALFLMFLGGNLYKKILSSAYVFLPILAVSFALAWYLRMKIEILGISTTLYFLPFFLIGLAFGKVKVLEMPVSSVRVIAGVLAIIAVEAINAYFKLPKLLVSSIWVVAILQMAPFFGDKFPKLFHTFRDYTFQIFLLAIFVQMPIRIMYRKVNGYYGVFFVLCCVLGVYIPVLVAKLSKSYLPKITLKPLGM